MKIVLKIVGLLLFTGGIFFLAIFTALPLVDSNKSDLIPLILGGYFIFWIFIMFFMIKKMFFMIKKMFGKNNQSIGKNKL